MPVSEIITLALVGAVLGAALGALGGGGGIIAIPLLIHVAGQPVDQATTTSLVVVALGAAAGLVPHALAGRVDWRGGLLFALLGVVGAFVGGKSALVLDDRLQVVGIFALMLLAAQALLRNADDVTATRMRHRVPPQPGMRVDTGVVIGSAPTGPRSHGLPSAAVGTGRPERRNGVGEDGGVGDGGADGEGEGEDQPGGPSGGSDAGLPATPGTAPTLSGGATTTTAGTRAVRVGTRTASAAEAEGYSWWRLVAAATVTGLITGVFGVGGGFVAVPALVFGLRLPIKIATATGLLVIVVNSFVALLARGPQLLEPGPTLVVGAASVTAAVAAAALSRHISPWATRRAFGFMLIGLAFWQLAALATLA